MPVIRIPSAFRTIEIPSIDFVMSLIVLKLEHFVVVVVVVVVAVMFVRSMTVALVPSQPVATSHS